MFKTVLTFVKILPDVVFFQEFLYVHDIIIDYVIFPLIHGDVDDGDLIVVENWICKYQIFIYN